jgi:putative ABC transport system permease protein
MYFFQVALINILRRPFRTTLTLGGVMLGIGAYVALVGFSSSFERQWLEFYRTKGTDLCVVRGTFLKSSADESLGAQLRALPMVAGVAAVSFDLIEFTQETSAFVIGWEDTSYEFGSLTLLQGRKFGKDEAEVMLGEILAESLHKKPGDTVRIQGAQFEVVGIFRGGESFETSGALLPLHQLQKISDLGSKVAGFHIRLRAPGPRQSAEAQFSQIKVLIENQFPGLTAVPVGDLAQNNYLATLVRSIAWGTSLIALFIGTLGIANTMAMSVHERTGEIGILRAMGWMRSRIVLLILLEATILSVAGGALGLIFGYFGLSALAVLRSTVPGVAHATISLPLCMQALGIAYCIGLAAGFLPAHRAASLVPMSALRHD